MHNMISIFVASWHDGIRRQTLDILRGQSDFFIAGVEKEAPNTLIKTEWLKPDVVILDFQLPGISALELAPMIHRRSAGTSILLLCNQGDEYHASLAYKNGIKGILLKDADINKLGLAVKMIFSGEYYISAPIFAKSLCSATFTQKETNAKQSMRFFSPAERGIFKYIACGLTNEEIAKQMNYSTGAIKNCLTAIMRKTNLENRVQIAIYSLVYGFVDIEDIEFLREFEEIREKS